MTEHGEAIANTTIRPKGIGGWLILPIIQLLFALGSTLYNLSALVTEWTGIKAIVQGANETALALRAPVMLSTFVGVLLIVMSAFALYRIFTYSPSVPKVMTLFYIACIVLTLGEAYADHMIDTISGGIDQQADLKDIASTVVAAAIWIPYFRRSRRVANTFRTREAAVDRQLGEIFS